MRKSANPVLVEVRRGDSVESRHRGACAVVVDGRLARSRGDVTARVFLRSAAKPFQAIAAIAAGIVERYGLLPEEIAVIAGSHSGEAPHVRAVGSLLRKGGLRETHLRCGTHAPYGARAAAALTRAGRRPTVLHNNCSGKHAGMLLFARAIGAPLEGYLDPSHPVQRAILETLCEFASVTPSGVTIAVDGCTAPTFALPVVALARAFERLVAPRGAVRPALALAASAIFAAVSARPEQLAGSGRICTRLVQLAPGRIFPKSGAEGVYAIGVRGSRAGLSAGIAVKSDDGQARGVRALLPGLLKATGLVGPKVVAGAERAADLVVRSRSGAAVGRITPRP